MFYASKNCIKVLGFWVKRANAQGFGSVLEFKHLKHVLRPKNGSLPK